MGREIERQRVREMETDKWRQRNKLREIESFCHFHGLLIFPKQ